MKVNKEFVKEVFEEKETVMIVKFECKNILDKLIDETSVDLVLKTISEICHEKFIYNMDCGNELLAEEWKDLSSKINKLV